MGVIFALRYALAPYPSETIAALSAESLATGGTSMPLAAALTRFTTEMGWLAALWAGLIVLWILIIVVQQSVKYTPATNRNYLPPQIFLAVATGLVIPGEALAGLLAAWLFVLSVRQFASSFHKDYRFPEVFRAGLYLGLMPLLYAPTAAIAPIVAIVSLSIYRRSWREFTVSLAGLLLPVPAAGFVHWAMGLPADFIYRELWRVATTPAGEDFFRDFMPLPSTVVAGVTAVLVLTGVFWAVTHKKGIRKTQQKFMLVSALSMAIVAVTALLPGTSPTIMPIIAVPAALCVPYAFSGKLAGISSIVYYVVIVACFALNLAPFFI